MDIIKNDKHVEVILPPADVESAVRQFICTTNPEFAKDWVINFKYMPGTVVMQGSKE